MWNSQKKLAYPLLKDTLSLVGSPKCEALLVLDLKDAFHSLRLCKHSKKYCGTLPYFASASHLSKNAHGIEYISFNMAIQHKCNFILPREQKIL